MAGLGFFLGGASEGFQQQQQQQSLSNFRLQELKLQEQAQANQEKRFSIAQADKARQELLDVITNTIDHSYAAGADPAQIAKAISGPKAMLLKFDQSSGRDPAMTDAIITARLAQPSFDQIMGGKPGYVAGTSDEAAPVGKPVAPQDSVNLTGPGKDIISTTVEEVPPGAPLTPSRPAAKPQTDDVDRLSRVLSALPKDSPMRDAVRMRLAEAIRIQNQKPEIKQVTRPDGTTGYQSVDPRSGKITDLTDESMSGRQQTAIHKAFDLDLHGTEFIKALPAEMRNEVKAIATYKQNPQTSSIRGGRREQMMAWVHQYDPSYDQTVFASKNRAMQVQGQRLGQITTAIENAKSTIPRVMETARAVPYRTNYPPINRLLQMTNEQIGDPNIVAFKVAVNTMVNNYARALGAGSTVLTDSARKEAEAILQEAWSNGQLDRATSQMMTEMQSELGGTRNAVQSLKQQYGEDEPAAPVKGSTTKDESKPSSLSNEELLKKLGVK